MANARILEELAALTHGVLATLHLLGLAYNLRRHNRFDATAHLLAAVYDLHAAGAHVAACKGPHDRA